MIPTHDMSHISTKCTECPFVYKLSTNQETRDLDLEQKLVTTAWQNGPSQVGVDRNKMWLQHKVYML